MAPRTSFVKRPTGESPGHAQMLPAKSHVSLIFAIWPTSHEVELGFRLVQLPLLCQLRKTATQAAMTRLAQLVTHASWRCAQ